METSAYEPKTLLEAIQYFADPQNCIDYLVARRPEWKDGVICPQCGSRTVGFLKNQMRWQCSNRHPQRQFSIKVGTIFEDSPLGLDKWFPAVWLIHNAKNGISSCEVARALGVTQKTAWFMLHRIRLSQHAKSGNKFSGQIEADETFIGGKARNMHATRRAKVITGTGGKDKTAVMGILERGSKITGSKVRVKVVDNTKKKTLQSEVREHVLAGSAIFTDALKSYEGLTEFQHEVIDHAVAYVNGDCHTNGLENFWSLVKRALKGTYVSVEPFHLFRYLDEEAWRYNNRIMNDAERFDLGIRGIIGKRITYKELIGKIKTEETETQPC
jgi:transposase-like protein